MVRPVIVLIRAVMVYTVPACPSASHITATVPSAVALLITRSPGLLGEIDTSNVDMTSPSLPITAGEILIS